MKRGSAFALLVCLSAAGGCMSQAKVVNANKFEGTVWIPNNTDEFPHYYHRDALELIDKLVDGQKYTTTEGPAKPAANPPGSTGSPSATGWWISYRVLGAPPSAASNRAPTNGFMPLNGVNSAGGMVPPNGTNPGGGVTSAGGMMPQPAPLPPGTVPNPYPAGGLR